MATNLGAKAAVEQRSASHFAQSHASPSKLHEVEVHRERFLERKRQLEETSAAQSIAAHRHSPRGSIFSPKPHLSVSFGSGSRGVSRTNSRITGLLNMSVEGSRTLDETDPSSLHLSGSGMPSRLLQQTSMHADQSSACDLSVEESLARVALSPGRGAAGGSRQALGALPALSVPGSVPVTARRGPYKSVLDPARQAEIDAQRRRRGSLIEENQEKLKAIRKKDGVAGMRRKYNRLVKDAGLPTDFGSDEDEEAEMTPEVEAVLAEGSRALTGEENAQVRSALSGPRGKAVGKVAKVVVEAHNLQNLGPGQWLDDTLIDFFLTLYSEADARTLVFSCFFWRQLTNPGTGGYDYERVRRWTKRRKVDIFDGSVDRILFPVNFSDVHWTLGVINLRKKRFEFYDSMYSPASGPPRCFAVFARYLDDESRDKKQCAFPTDEWAAYVPPKLPRQANGFDCGMFTIKYAQALLLNAPFAFTQEQMPAIRRRAILEVLRHPPT